VIPRTATSEGIASVLTILADSSAEIRRLVAGVADEQLRREPTPGAWSIQDNLAHVLTSAEEWSTGILGALGAPAPPRSTSAVEQKMHTQYRQLPFTQVLDGFDALRSVVLAALRGLDLAGWETVGTFEGHKLTVFGMAYRMARHERIHWQQIGTTARRFRRRAAE
jgi:hypothetical protein